MWSWHPWVRAGQKLGTLWKGTFPTVSFSFGNCIGRASGDIRDHTRASLSLPRASHECQENKLLARMLVAPLTTILLMVLVSLSNCCYYLRQGLLSWPKTHCVVQFALKHTIILSRLSKCQDYRHASWHPASINLCETASDCVGQAGLNFVAQAGLKLSVILP